MENIKDYEKMAKFDLPDAEREQISKSADRLIESFGALADVDTDGVEPLYTVLQISNVLREDVSSKMISREELLQNAPMKSEGYFQVPKTI